MDKEDIIRMAREAEATEIGHKPPAFHFYLADLERFAKLVAAAEREACAMECIKKANEWTRLGAWGSNNEFYQCAEAIRARGQQ